MEGTATIGAAEGTAIAPPVTVSAATGAAMVECIDLKLETLDADVGTVMDIIETLSKRVRKLERRHRDLVEEVEGQRVMIDLLRSRRER
jgi:hypothetical protein